MEITMEVSGLDAAIKATDPKQVEVAQILWFARSTVYLRQQLRASAPSRIKGKVRSMTDGRHPPNWARVYVASPLAHLLEGGTGALGAPGFQHRQGFFPSVTGIMRQTGLPKPQAYLVARAIFQQGGMRPQPFIGPTWEASKDEVVAIGVAAAAEAQQRTQT